jgi:hypothetical protein
VGVVGQQGQRTRERLKAVGRRQAIHPLELLLADPDLVRDAGGIATMPHEPDGPRRGQLLRRSAKGRQRLAPVGMECVGEAARVEPDDHVARPRLRAAEGAAALVLLKQSVEPVRPGEKQRVPTSELPKPRPDDLAVRPPAR